MAISTAAAILGSAVIGGIASSSPASKASKASNEATTQTLALNQRQYEQTRADQQPFVQAGYGALNALTARLGIQPATNTSGVVSPTTSGAPVSWDAAQPSATNALRSKPAGGMVANYGTPAGGGTFDAAVAGAQRDGFAPSGAAPGTVSAPSTAPSGTTYQPGVTASPSAPATAAPTGGGVDPGTYGNADPNYTRTDYTAPADFKYDLADYKQSPAYQYQQDEGRKSILASASATGALQSGSALKALQDRAQQIAYQDFTQERGFAAGRSDADRTFHRTDFADQRDFDYGKATSDRNYLSGRFDTGTSNLFGLTSIGTNAAGVVGAAGASNTAAATNALTGNAANKANAAIAGSNTVNSLLGAGVNAIAYDNGRRSPYVF